MLLSISLSLGRIILYIILFFIVGLIIIDEAMEMLGKIRLPKKQLSGKKLYALEALIIIISLIILSLLFKSVYPINYLEISKTLGTICKGDIYAIYVASIPVAT